MGAEEQLIRAACVAASSELDVRIVTPFNLVSDDGSLVEFIALFPDFGSPKGTAVCHFRDWPVKKEVAERHGMYCSGLHPDSYSRYDRQMFVETFEEWGWLCRTSEPLEWCKRGA